MASGISLHFCVCFPSAPLPVSSIYAILPWCGSLGPGTDFLHSYESHALRGHLPGKAEMIFSFHSSFFHQGYEAEGPCEVRTGSL